MRLSFSTPQASDLIESTNKRCNLCLLIAAICKTILDLAQSFDDEDLHLICHLSLKNLLVNSFDDIVKSE